MANALSIESVTQALKTVKDPDLGRDLVSLGMIKDVVVSLTGEVFFTVVLTTPACPMKAKIEADCLAAVRALPGVNGVKIKMDAEVRGRAKNVGTGAAQSNEIQGVKNIIAVSSGKGGVGKSTVAVNLAVGLALEGAKVGIMDADVYGPNIPTMLGVTEQPKLEKLENGTERFIPPTAYGMKVMSMGFLIPSDQPLIWRGPMLHSVVNQFCHQVAWGDLDYLIIDMPPGTGDVQLSMAQIVPVTGAVLVTTPQEVSLQDVRRAFAMFEKVRVPILGIVENMSYFVCDGCSKKHTVFGSDGAKGLAKKLHSEVLAELPLVEAVREGGDAGRPVVATGASSELAQAFKALAQKTAQKVAVLNASQAGEQLIQIGKFF